MKSKKKANQENPDKRRLILEKRNLAVFAGACLCKPPESPRPLDVKGRIRWVIHTALTVGQIKQAYRKSGDIYTALEMYIETGKHIKTQKPMIKE